MKAIFIPGNGGGSPKDNWFPYIKKELEKLEIEVIDKEFPDNDIAKESSWIPFLHELQADKDTILIGHSSGAIAAMRFAEKNPILGSVLVGVYHTDLGLPKEIESGYFNRPWDWEAIRKNQKWIIEFASVDDPWIPIEQPRFIRDKLQTEYHEFIDQGHFGGDYEKTIFPEIIQAIKARL